MKWTFKKAISIFRYLIQPLGMINAPVDLTQSEIITAYAVLCLQMIHSYRKVRDKENCISTMINPKEKLESLKLIFGSQVEAVHRSLH